MNTLNDEIKAQARTLFKESKSIAKVKGYLAFLEISGKDISAFLKSENISSTRTTGFKAGYYEFLAEAPRTKTEAEDYIDAYGSDNVIAHKSAHILSLDLSLVIWAKLDTLIKEATDEPEATLTPLLNEIPEVKPAVKPKAKTTPKKAASK